MTTTTTARPNLARQQLEQLLKRMRREAGKTHEDLKVAGIASRSKMSTIESGTTRLGDYDRDVITLLADDCATTVQVVEAA